MEVNKIVEETLLLVQKTLAADNIRIDVTLAPALPAIGADASALQQVMLNRRAPPWGARSPEQPGGARLDECPRPASPGADNPGRASGSTCAN